MGLAGTSSSWLASKLSHFPAVWEPFEERLSYLQVHQGHRIDYDTFEARDEARPITLSTAAAVSFRWCDMVIVPTRHHSLRILELDHQSSYDPSCRHQLSSLYLVSSVCLVVFMYLNLCALKFMLWLHNSLYKYSSSSLLNLLFCCCGETCRDVCRHGIHSTSHHHIRTP